MLTAAIGIGGGLLMLATLAQVLPAKAIIPIHGAVQVGSNAGRALVMLKNVHWDILLWFCAGSIIGAIGGGKLVINLPLDFIRGLLGSFILFTVWGPKTVNLVKNRTTLAIGGLLSTFLTMFVGATGPFVIVMVRSFSMGKLGLFATSAASLIIQHSLKVLVFGLLGFEILLTIDEQRFKWWLNVVLSVLALRLVWVAIF